MRKIAVSAALLAMLVPAAPALAANNPILTTGMRAPAVKKVQKALGVQATGYFGKTTRKAVVSYQKAHGIPTTGIVGPKTWASLQAGTTSKPAQPAKPAKKPAKKPTKPVKKPAKKKSTGTTPALSRTLSYGDRGKDVLYVQQKLGVQPQTGYFGPITQAYVKALQSAAKLPVTGTVDAKTWAKLGRVKFTPPATTTTTTTTSPLPAPSSATAAKVLQIAKSLAGIPYVANGYSPEQGFNCSSYTQWVYKQVGIDLGGAYTVWQYNKSKHISASEAKPGDLVFFYNYKDNFIGHVGIYAGNGMIWHAPRTGRVVSLEKIWTDKVYYGRVLNH